MSLRASETTGGVPRSERSELWGFPTMFSTGEGVAPRGGLAPRKLTIYAIRNLISERNTPIPKTHYQPNHIKKGQTHE